METQSPVTKGITSSQSPTLTRLWRPAAQRNLRNQWSKLLSGKHQWASTATEGRSSATGIVNAYLSQRYMPEMDLGVLKEIPGIKEKACKKLARKQDICCTKLLASYKDMVDIVSQLFKSSNCMRCFLKGSTNSSLVRFCNSSEDGNDLGDGGGIPVFSSWSILQFENLAQELVRMFSLELQFKRLLVVELLSISCKEPSAEKNSGLCWSDELYTGEFDDLSLCNLICKENCQPIFPGTKNLESDNPHLNREILQVYLTAWLSDINIDMYRVEDMFAMVEEEMQVKLS